MSKGKEKREHLYYSGPPEALLKGKPPKKARPLNNPVILYTSPVQNPDYAPVTNQLRNQTLILKDANLQGGFAQVPSLVLRDPRLSSNAKVLYALLLSYAWGHNQCFPGQKRLAEDMGVNLSTVGRTLAELNEQCLVSWKRQGLGLTNIYYIERLSDGYLKHYPQASEGRDAGAG